MIVCVCNVISDRDIRASVAGGIESFEALQGETGIGTCCGCCQDCAREIFDAQHDEALSA